MNPFPHRHSSMETIKNRVHDMDRFRFDFFLLSLKKVRELLDQPQVSSQKIPFSLLRVL